MIAGIALAALAAAPGIVRGIVSVKAKDGTDKADRSEVVLYLADVDAPVSGARAHVFQRGKQFVPRVLAIASGTEVDFPNEDSEEHNVFSHSAAADFDLGRFAGGRRKSRTFTEVGVVELFCNVHREMIAYIVVVPSAAFAVTSADGKFEISGVPPGRHRLIVWQRFTRPRARALQIDVPATGSAEVKVELDEQLDSEPAHKNKFGVEYPAGYH